MGGGPAVAAVGRGLDRRPDHFQRRGAIHSAQLGARARTGDLSDGVQRRHGRRQPGLGPAGAGDRRSRHFAGGCRGPARGRPGPAPHAPAPRRGQSGPVQPLARTASGCARRT
ncbi:hypothetical protein G6F31_021245 [Rhizopus arrhizus]|nr:hypothetical protein G6F31_021245 [Rhizopus arrhizus]